MNDDDDDDDEIVSINSVEKKIAFHAPIDVVLPFIQKIATF